MKYSTIYTIFAIFLTSEVTKYASASGGLRVLWTPLGEFRPPDPLTLPPFLNSKYATVCQDLSPYNILEYSELLIFRASAGIVVLYFFPVCDALLYEVCQRRNGIRL